MAREDHEQLLGIKDVASRSGVSEGTLRMWEARHNFPVPRRLPSGHRRYSELDLKRVLAVLERRDQGVSLPAAIAWARQVTEEPRPSVYAALRDRFAHLRPQLMPKPLLRTLSYAIEDEGCARANRPLLFGCFQREHFYRQVESRWREMTRTAELAIVLADFRRARHPRGGPAEVPIGATDPLIREWVVVSVGATFSGCLVGFEPPGQPRSQRSFETIWSGERVVVREAARVCCGLVARTAPDVVDGVGERLQQDQLPVREELTALVELATRMVSYATTAR